MTTLVEQLESLPFETKLMLLTASMKGIVEGKDETLRALARHAHAVPTHPVLVGGAAVIRHGYRRTTDDRDVLVSFRDVKALADRLMDDPDWERLEIAQYAFLYTPSGIKVDFLVSRNLMRLGLPYYFPDVQTVTTEDSVEGLSVIDLHELLFFKMIAGRMRDLADVMELCKRHLGIIDPHRVIGRLEPEDDEIRMQFLEILENAPREIAEETRLGQQDAAYKVGAQQPKAGQAFRQRAAVWIGQHWWAAFRASWPIGWIEVTRNEVTVQGWRFTRDEITSIRRKRIAFCRWIKIEHRCAYPKWLVFWTFHFRRLRTAFEKRGWKIE